MPDKNEIGDAFSEALRKMLDEKPGRTVIAAARQLGVSRQAFHAYLSGKLPRRKMLNRAMHLWDLKLDLGEHSFDKEAFPTKETTKKTASAKPSQLELWDLLDAVRGEDLHVTMKRVGKTLRFEVRIEIPA